MRTYRVAILGCRMRGTAHARAYHAHPRTELVALCDRVPELLDTLGNELGVRARFTDADTMIRETRPDLVSIPVGTELHHPLAMQVLEHGVHIEVEKPFCPELSQADEVLAKAREKRVRVAVHHQKRVSANMEAIARMFAAGKIGALRHVQGGGKGYYGGFDLLDIGTHLINDMLRFTGHVRSVTASAVTDGRPITPEDVLTAPGGMGALAGEQITATLQCEGGVSATLLEHRYAKVVNAGYTLELIGTEGRLLWTRTSGAWYLPTPHPVPDGAHGRWQPLEPVVPEYRPRDLHDPLDDFGFVDEYVKALDEDRDHASSGAEGRHVLEIIMAIFESAAYRRHVDVPQQRRDHPLLRWRAEHGLPPPAPAPRTYADWIEAEDRRLGRAGG